MKKRRQHFTSFYRKTTTPCGLRALGVPTCPVQPAPIRTLGGLSLRTKEPLPDACIQTRAVKCATFTFSKKKILENLPVNSSTTAQIAIKKRTEVCRAQVAQEIPQSVPPPETTEIKLTQDTTPLPTRPAGTWTAVKTFLK